MRGWKVVAIASIVLFLIGVAAPRRVQAGNSITDGLIIGGISAGVVATILIIAILVAGHEEPGEEMLGLAPLEPTQHGPQGMRVGCRQADGTIALACW